MAENDVTTRTRLPRELDSRAGATRAKSWQPPALLPDAAPEAGYVFRWIRISTLNVDDPMNVSSKLREGWEPVKASEHPELQLVSTPSERFKDSVQVGGLMLCKIPAEFMEQRAAYYRQQTDSQMSSVDNNFMRENDPRMPLFADKRTSVSFGKGNQS
jgi:hypothetical protein